MNRSQFLLRAAAAPVVLRGALASTEAGAATSEAVLDDWSSVRSEFALAPKLTQMAAFLFSSHPRMVREAIERHRRGLDANPHGYLDQAGSFEERARSAAARFIGSSPEQVALTDSTTMGLGLLYGGLALHPGEEVLTTVHDFYSTHASLALRAQATGARLRKIALYREPRTASADEIVKNLATALRPETRFVAITWVHSSTGVKLPVRQIADAIGNVNASRPASRQIRLCVDGVHGFGIEEDKIAALGCDYFASGCHKWLFGPRGTGLLWSKDPGWGGANEIIPTFDHPTIGAWISSQPEPPLSGPRMTPGGYHSFEHRWALTEAFAFRERLGAARVAARTHQLAAHLKTELAKLRGVAVRTPMASSLSSGLVCCSLEGQDPNTFVERLFTKQRVVASVTPYASQLVRFGPTIVNSDEDVERTVRAVRSLL